MRAQDEAEQIELVLDSNGGANYTDGEWEDFYTWEFLMNDCGDFDWLSFEPNPELLAVGGGR